MTAVEWWPKERVRYGFWAAPNCALFMSIVVLNKLFDSDAMVRAIVDCGPLWPPMPITFVAILFKPSTFNPNRR
jgi:hypothetical protein